MAEHGRSDYTCGRYNIQTVFEWHRGTGKINVIAYKSQWLVMVIDSSKESEETECLKLKKMHYFYVRICGLFLFKSELHYN